MPPGPNFEHYPQQFAPGTLPPPQQQQQQPSNFQAGANPDTLYNSSVGMSSASTAPATSAPAPAAPTGTRPQGTLPPPASDSSFSPSSSSSATTPSLLSQQHHQLQQQQQQQQYPGPMSGSNPHGQGGLPPSHARSGQADSSAQYLGVTSHADGQEQRQQQQQPQPQPQNLQAHHHQRPPHPGVTYPPMGVHPINIPPHLPPLLNNSNPHHLPHPFGHDYSGAYPENLPPIPNSQRDPPRHAPPSGPTSSEGRRRTPSSRHSRRTTVPTAALPSERDLDGDDMSPAQSPEAAIENVVNAGLGRHGPNDRHLRAAQIFRGSVSTKKVASSSAISALQSVEIESLSEAERSCVICYNDFGTETPEGVKEAPLRLPNCKHIFGDHCIKKWFEESDSCPYCRSKVPSDVRFVADGRALMDLMRSRRGAQPFDLGSGPVSQEAILRLIASQTAGGHRFEVTGGGGGMRRSPPTESDEHRRRIRPRHSGNVSSPRFDGPSGGNARPSSFGGLPSSSNHTPPSRDRYPLGDSLEDTYPMRVQGREREWLALQVSRETARLSHQSRVPPNIYGAYPWDESPLVDPAGRLPMPASGGLPPMSGFPSQNTIPRASVREQPFSSDQPPPPGFPHLQSLGWRAQRESGTAGVSSTISSGFNSTQTNPVPADVDTPMPDRSPAP
ncbi:uncharacterized protein DNG_03685 [Cephalotrichum gorgonifer]|uniref:RING-type domain-containing protein n=1 Tax=Cephalotrichum gorgonifer TaxID=2041049 RepID=A0AAE8MWQ0_9PEZI|nr:uncharacterized protein DNG_03685 [Cephalotrichum gorgonifer]